MVNVLIKIEKQRREKRGRLGHAWESLLFWDAWNFLVSREMKPIGKASYLSLALEDSSIDMALAGLSSFGEADLALSAGSRTGLQHLRGGRQA